MKKGTENYIKMTLLAVFSLLAAAVFYVLLLNYKIEAFFTVAITFFTVFFHLFIRLVIGTVVDRVKINPNLKYFETKKFESKLYSFLRVGKWKGNAFTFAPEKFSSDNSLEYILERTYEAELVHAIIIPVSYLSLLFTLFCDSFIYFLVFFLTATLANLFEISCVIIQRYNRPRLKRLIKIRDIREKKKEKS